MGMLFAMTLPALVIGLCVLGVIELATRKAGHRGPNVSAGGFEFMSALLQPSRRIQVEQREHEALMREDDEDGAPPRSRIDLDRGTAHIVLPRG
jgi:Family of unknown function (DUF6191)